MPGANMPTPDEAPGRTQLKELIAAALEGEENPGIVIGAICGDWWRSTNPPELQAHCHHFAESLMVRMKRDGENWEETWTNVHNYALRLLAGLHDMAFEHESAIERLEAGIKDEVERMRSALAASSREITS